MKRILALAIIILSLLGLTACQDAKEVSYTMAVIAIGIDEGESSKYKISFAMEKGNSGESGGESGGKESEKEEKNGDIITVEAPTIPAAVETANDLVSLDITIENVEMVLLSEALCKKGIYDTIYELVTATDLKNNSYVVAIKGKTKDVIENIKPESEEYASNFYSKVLFNHYAKNARFFLLSEVYFNMVSESGQDIILPLASKQEKETEGENEYKDDINSFLVAGKVPKSSKHNVVFMGGAVFKDEKLTGYIDESDIVATSMIYGDYKPRQISIEYPKNSKRYVVVNLRQRFLPRYIESVEDGRIKEHVIIDLVGDYEVIYPYEGYLRFDREFTMFMKNEIEKKCEQIYYAASRELDADILSVGKRIRKCFLTNEAYKNFNYREKLKTGEYKVEVRLDMRRAGRLTFE